MSDFDAVRVICQPCATKVGRVTREPDGTGHFRMDSPIEEQHIVVGFEGVMADARTAKQQGNPFRPRRFVDLPIDEPADDFRDRFPTWCPRHHDGRVDRFALVDKFREFERTGIPQEVLVIP